MTDERATLSRGVLILGAVLSLALIATSTRYGYHRDELYFIVSGQHPAWGYPDQPALVPLLAAGLHAVWPGLLLLRLPSAIAAGLTVLFAGLVARDLGGDRRPQIVAAACTAVAGFPAAAGHIVSTTTFDMLSTTILLWLLVRAAMRGPGPALLLAGVVTGIGFEIKPQVGFVAAVALVSLALVGPRGLLRSRWLYAGVAAAVLLALPYVIWQGMHGWPQFGVAQDVAGSAEGGRVGFVPFQIVLVSPVLVPVWVAGLITPWSRAALRPIRFLTVSYVALGLAYIAGDGKAYYLASLYPVVLGVGALPAADWLLRGRTALRRGVLVGAVVISALLSAVIALPLLPANRLQGSVVMALNPDQGETVGWPAFITDVTRGWDDLPAARRADTAIFTQNYGEAGAIDLLGGRALPGAYSGHVAYGEWGPPPNSDTSALVIGWMAVADLPPAFTACRPLTRVHNGVGLDNDEQDVLIASCRLATPWSRVWPSLRHD